jgi:sec-independent protein translocase protein TatA
MPISPMEIVLIVLLILLLFGASRLPKMGRSLGLGLRGFKDELSEGIKEDDRDRVGSEGVAPREEVAARPIERH